MNGQMVNEGMCHSDKHHTVYMLILKLVESLNGDEYHKVKFAWAHQLWAHQGQFVKFLSHSVRSKLLIPINDALPHRLIQLKRSSQEGLLFILTKLSLTNIYGFEAHFALFMIFML